MNKIKPVVPYKFTNEEIQRLKCHLETDKKQAEVIGLLDSYSASFADWSIIISKSVHETIANKQQLNEDYATEQEMLENFSFLFTKLAYYSGMLSEWHKQLTLGNELTEKMIAEGRP
jgi:hypothetical protein